MRLRLERRQREPVGLGAEAVAVGPGAEHQVEQPLGPARGRRAPRRSRRRRGPRAAVLARRPPGAPPPRRRSRRSRATSAFGPWPVTIPVRRRSIAPTRRGWSGLGREHRRRVVRHVAHGELVEARRRSAELRERRRPGQDHVGVAGRLVDVDVERDHEVELLERRSRGGPSSGCERPGLPATVISARTWPSPGVSISSARHDDGQLAEDLGQPADAALPAADRGRRGPRRASPAEFDWPAAARVNIAPPAPVEVPGQHVEHVDEPARERPELLRAWCRCGRRRAALGAAASSRAMPRIVLGVDPAGRRDQLRGELARERARPRSSPSTCSATGPGSTRPSSKSVVDHREEQERVGARAG